MPSATMKSDPRGPTSWWRTSAGGSRSRCSGPRRGRCPRCGRERAEIGLPKHGHLNRTAHHPHTGGVRHLQASHNLPELTGSDGKSHSAEYTLMIHLETWECDESRPPREERQRPLVVSLSQRVPCSHDPPRARAPVLGARRRRCEPRRLRVHAKPLRSGIASDRPRAGARSHPDGDERAPARQAGAWPPRPSGRIPAPDAVLHIRDSSFVFGSAGTGDARVTIDGQPARVWPNGAWLAYVHLPTDSLIPLRIEAHTARIPQPWSIPCGARCPTPAASSWARSGWIPVARADREALALAGRIPRPHCPRERRRRGPTATRGRNRRAPHTAAGSP